MLAVGMPAGDDDAFGAEVGGGQDAEQSHGSVAYHGNGLARFDPGGDRAEPAGCEDVGGGQLAGDQVGGW